MNNKLPQRKNIRLKGYDYSLEGYYFITICTKNRKEILGKIKPVGVAFLGDPKQNITEKIYLTGEGKIVNKHINNFNKVFKDIFMDEYIIMPNHIHLIVALSNYTLSNTLRIHKAPEFREIVKQILIFNITKYNESDKITLIEENGGKIEFIKK